jgi:hypothetical protein
MGVGKNMDILEVISPAVAEIPLAVLAVLFMTLIVVRVLSHQNAEDKYNSRAADRLFDLFTRNMEVTDKLEAAILRLSEVQVDTNKSRAEALKQHHDELLKELAATEARIMCAIEGLKEK